MPFRRLRLPPRLLSDGSRNVLSGSFWVIMGAGWSQGSMLLVSLIVANMLGTSGYGRYALLQSSLIMLALLAQAGFGTVIAQQVSRLRERDPAKAGEVAGFCFLVTVVISASFAATLLLGRESVAEDLFRDAALQRGILLVAAAFPCLALAYVQMGLFSGLEGFKDQARISLYASPALIALPPLGALHYGFEGAILGLAAAYLVRVVITQLILSRLLAAHGIRLSLGNLKSQSALLWRFALPATVSGVMTHLAIWGGQTLLVRAEGGQSALGLFAAAFVVKTMVMFIPAQMPAVLLPILSRYSSSDSTRQWRNLLLAGVAATVAITGALATIGILFAAPIMGLFGPEFEAGKSVLILLLLATPIEAACLSLLYGLYSESRFWRPILFQSLPVTGTVLVTAALLIPAQLANGLAIAWLGGWAMSLIGLTLALRPLSRSRDRPAPAVEAGSHV